MNEIWLEELKKAMDTQNISKEQLAKHLQISESEMERLLEGELRLSFSQLAKLSAYLHIDLHRMMGCHEESMDLVLHDDLEIKINKIARGIPSGRRGYFVQAVEYLAELFHTKGDQEELPASKDHEIETQGKCKKGDKRKSGQRKKTHKAS
ncbi:MAG: helix-turn-helix transcriptional regulator [Erysipelotrichaceae bacterium]|nr:helix-turn-helix transcriptional regulator [Erysipelotrichaceae bacterium]